MTTTMATPTKALELNRSEIRDMIAPAVKLGDRICESAKRGERSAFGDRADKFQLADYWNSETDRGAMAMGAVAFALYYQQTLPFMVDMKLRIKRGQQLNEKQIVGICNCLMAEIRRQRRNASSPTPSSPQGAGAARQAPSETVFARSMPNEHYTVRFADGSGHVTLRIRAWVQNGVKVEGKQQVAYLNGADNTRNYKPIGVLVGRSFRRFGQLRSDTKVARAIEALAKLAQFTSSELERAGLEFATTSKRCRRCGALLTNDKTIEECRGYGPICVDKA